MIPIALDPSAVSLAVAGNGGLALRRLRALRRGGASLTRLFADHPAPELAAEAGGHLIRRLPDAADLAQLGVLWIAGLDAGAAASLAASAHAQRVLVNVEDAPEHCAFHSVAELRRGALLLTVSTSGAAPGLARAIRRGLEHCFPPEWADRVAEIAGLRREWHAAGLPMAEAASRIETLVAERGWLGCRRPD